MVEEERPREISEVREGIGTLPEGEEGSEGALVRIADILEAALDVENEHSLAYEVWRIRKAIESLTGQDYCDLGILHLRWNAQASLESLLCEVFQACGCS